VTVILYLSLSNALPISKNQVTKEYQILQPEKLDVLIKKGFVLSKDYEPKELVIPNIPIAPDCNNKKLRKDAAKALEEIYQDALKSEEHTSALQSRFDLV